MFFLYVPMVFSYFPMFFSYFPMIFPCFTYDFLCMFTMIFQMFPIIFLYIFLWLYFPIWFSNMFSISSRIFPQFSQTFRGIPAVPSSGGRFARRCTSSARSSNSSASPGAFLAVKQWEDPLVLLWVRHWLVHDYTMVIIWWLYNCFLWL